MIMKRLFSYLFLLALAGGGISCSDDSNDDIAGNEGGEAQSIACSIEAPADGAEVDKSEPLTIKGSATISDGTITRSVLTVDGHVIEEVTTVPFDYDYAIPADRAEGELLIELTVEGDRGAQASAHIAVQVVQSADPDPDPDPEPDPVPQGSFTDSRDGKTYKTVTIGEQIWFAENLAWLPQVNNIDEQSALASLENRKFYYVLHYNGNDVAAAKATVEYAAYGVLYNWFAAVDEDDAAGGDATAVPSGVQGACPAGWHLPSKAEWEKLEAYVAEGLPDVRYQGYDEDYNDVWFENGRNVWSALAAQEGWGEIDETYTSKYPDLLNGATNSTGFNAVPSGRYTPSRWDEVQDFDSVFGFDDGKFYCWLTHKDTYGAGSISLTDSQYGINYAKGGFHTSIGQPIRCVKD